jgi:peptidoglycan/xylan/chitin deacetylase (PgdA/CDA1 family)
LLSNWTKVNPVIVYYHMVSDNDVPHVKYIYPIRRVKQFEDDIDTFLRVYKVITLHQLLDSVRGGKPLAANSFLLTFDDGFSEIYDVVAPILLRKGVPATFFLNTAFLDNRGMAHHNKISLLLDHFARLKCEPPYEEIAHILLGHGIARGNIETALLSIDYDNVDAVERIATAVNVKFHSYLSTARPYLSSEEVRRLINSGFTIGAHSIDHPRYSALSIGEQLYQTEASVRLLRERFSLTYGAFAFPHGDSGVSQEFFDRMFTQVDVDVSFGTAGMLQDVNRGHFQRCSMEYATSSARQALGHHYARGLYKRLSGHSIMNHC